MVVRTVGRARVLVVDDSVVLRKYLSDVISKEPATEVVGVASNGRIALAKLAQLLPDVVLLDLEMPDLDGLETLRQLRKAHPRLPVIMCSSLTQRGATATFEALALGANDYIAKPSSAGGDAERLEFEAQLPAKILALAPRSQAAWTTPRPQQPAPVPPPRRLTPPPRLTLRRPEVVGIGVSTGGPNALALLLPALPADFPVPVLIVQHMPPLFTNLLARRLANASRIAVVEAEDGQPVNAGTAYIAPGDFHMELAGTLASPLIRLHKGPHENSCRPAVDVLFRSLAERFGGAVLAAVLTGMGQDGLRGAEQIHAAGGEILAQDEQSSVVWGMPGFVAGAGLCDEVLPIGEIAGALTRRFSRGRTRTEANTEAGE